MDIKTVGIVGCGLMGAGIAQTAAESGYTTIVRELDARTSRKGAWTHSQLSRQRC